MSAKTPRTQKPDIFVSYARRHQALVNPLVQMLRVGDRTIFQDVMSIAPGDLWQDVIEKSLRRAKAVFVIWCQHAQRSHWVRLEYQTAITLKKPLYPVRIDQTPFPEDLGRFQAIDLSRSVRHEATRPRPKPPGASEFASIVVPGEGGSQKVPQWIEPVDRSDSQDGQTLARAVMAKVEELNL